MPSDMIAAPLSDDAEVVVPAVVPMPSIDRAVMWPFRLLGLTGADGYLSFSKMMAIAIFWGCFWLGALSLGVVIALLAAAFGVKVFLAFINRATVTATETATYDVAAVTKDVSQRIRDARAGRDFESTP